VAGSFRDDFPNNLVGDLVPTDRGWVLVPPTLPRGPRLQRRRLVSQLGVVYMHWAPLADGPSIIKTSNRQYPR
jgi:hypothetical protein